MNKQECLVPLKANFNNLFNERAGSVLLIILPPAYINAVRGGRLDRALHFAQVASGHFGGFV